MNRPATIHELRDINADLLADKIYLLAALKNIAETPEQRSDIQTYAWAQYIMHGGKR